MVLCDWYTRQRSKRETANPCVPTSWHPGSFDLVGYGFTMTSRKHLNKWFSFAQLGSRKVTASELPVR